MDTLEQRLRYAIGPFAMSSSRAHEISMRRCLICGMEQGAATLRLAQSTIADKLSLSEAPIELLSFRRKLGHVSIRCELCWDCAALIKLLARLARVS